MHDLIFDLDGTLFERWTTNLLPGALDLVRCYGAAPIVTNQAGPAWRIWDPGGRYPSAQDVAERLLACVRFLEVPVYLHICTYDPRIVQKDRRSGEYACKAAAASISGFMRRGNRSRPHNLIHLKVTADPTWRKPQPGSIVAMARRTMNAPLARVTYIGDSPQDRQAAFRAGVKFVWAEEALRWGYEGTYTYLRERQK